MVHYKTIRINPSAHCFARDLYWKYIETDGVVSEVFTLHPIKVVKACDKLGLIPKNIKPLVLKNAFLK